MLKPRQVRHIIDDCQASLLISSVSRYQTLRNDLKNSSLTQIIFSDKTLRLSNDLPIVTNISYWIDIYNEKDIAQIMIDEYEENGDEDIAALFYTSGSTGKAKGVCITHNNLLSGTSLVMDYCQISNKDKILALLSFSFDYGFNQICTTFKAAATLVLFDYLLPRDIIKIINKEQITGLAAVPSVWIQLAQLKSNEAQKNNIKIKKTTENPLSSLRFITNSGGKLPYQTIKVLQQKIPRAQIYLMYGLTEAFRSTFLEPSLVELYPNSMGKALNGEEIYIVDEHGIPCPQGVVGQLIHRGSLVSKGYWNRPELNQLTFKKLDNKYFPKSHYKAVFSGDLVKIDEKGLFYFVHRQDQMIKTSGNRVSPTEIEEICYQYSEINEAAIIGVEHPSLGQAIVFIGAVSTNYNETEFIRHIRTNLPNFMHPLKLIIKNELKKSVNGKINKKLLLEQYHSLFTA